MTIFLRAPRSFDWPARAGAVLLALAAAAAPVGASAPMPLSTAVRASDGVIPVLFKYEDLFGRSAARPKSYRQVDLDRDQVLSREELQKAFGSRWRAVLTSLDRNTDGLVTIDEVQSSGSSWSEERKAREKQRSGSRSDGAAGRSHSTGSAPGNRGNTSGDVEGAGNRGGNDPGSRGNAGGNSPGSGGNAGGNSSGSGGNGGGNNSGSGGNGGGNGPGSGGNRGRN